MIRSRGFACVTAADFVVRSAYQMGKTPLLPVLALGLGATDAFLGFIVSVSTLTGMVCKPFVGSLSDRWGRRRWLLVGTLFFSLMPFAYRFIGSPEELFAVRMVHGMATAIYGPVTLAYVAEQARRGRAERLAWFGTARNAGYIVGPAAAGWMLLTMEPVTVFTVIGLLSALAFLPVALLPDTTSARGERQPLGRQVTRALISGARTPAVWLAGGLDAANFVALYATKTFLTVYALSTGFSVATVGTFFAVQEAAHLVLNPVGGRVGDRAGHLFAVPLGMAALGAAVALLPMARTTPWLLTLAVAIGASQALVFPSTLALVSSRVREGELGAGMGLAGTLRNAGKVAGPVLAGVLIHWMDYGATFRVMGLCLVLTALVVRVGLQRLPGHGRGPITVPYEAS